MKYLSFSAVVCLALLLLYFTPDRKAANAAPTPIVVWVAAPMQRVSETELPSNASAVNLFAARGEYEAFQIVIRAASQALTNVSAAVSDLEGPGRIDGSNFTLYREHLVRVAQSSPDLGGPNRPQGTGYYPDALIPFVNPETGDPVRGGALEGAPFDIQVNRNQTLWIDLFVPRDALPGAYNATVTISSDQGTATLPISLTVWRFTLPLTPSLKSSFGLHAPYDTDRRAHELLLRHKLIPAIVNPGDGEELSARFGLATSALWFFSSTNSTNCRMQSAPSVQEIRHQVSRYPQGFDLYIYPADEIDRCANVFPTLRQWAFNMHQAGVKSLVTVTPNPELYDDGSGAGRSAVDIWVLLPLMYDAAPQRVAEVLAKGDEVWSYTALVQDKYSPKWEMDFAPANYRIQAGFLSAKMRLTGLLYWRIDLFSSDPWNNVNTYTTGRSFYPGEGMLVYPGKQIGLTSLVPSMRLKWLRKGVEDYEYVQILKGLGYGDWALEVATQAGTDWHTWSSDPAVIENVRYQLGSRIDQLAGAN